MWNKCVDFLELKGKVFSSIEVDEDEINFVLSDGSGKYKMLHY